MEFVFGQDVETALSGNGGAANSSASGGAAALGDINSGFNAGSAIGVGDTAGGMVCDEWGKCYPGDGGSVAVHGGATSASRPTAARRSPMLPVATATSPSSASQLAGRTAPAAMC